MIGSKIRRYRLKKGLTLQELARKTTTTAGYLSQLERGLTELVLYLASQPYGLSSASTDAIYTRWNHSFSIPFTVEESAEALPSPEAPAPDAGETGTE